ncbi:MAG TPA: MFS transporter, partial [Actinomycetes bacterium]|nr:MFS transporter [Actinomycetes bacterium]
MSSPTTTAEPGRAPGGADPRRWVALAVVLIAGFMQLVDISIVNVAIPSIQRDLDATYSQIQWVLAGYQLAFAVMLITGGRLGDIYGRKRLFMTGMAGFVLASALCGLAQSMGMLIGSRILQGLMGAIMFPHILSVIQVTFPPRERGTAFGLFGATIGLATITGPLVGGLLINADLFGLEWRPIF